jgi:hypothetical protein
MTYDPNDLRNDLRRPDLPPESDRMSAGAMAGIAFALLLFLGVMLWVFGSGDRQTASTNAPPPATTGQGAPAPSPAPK